MRIEELARRGAENALFFIERPIWHTMWLEVLPKASVPDIEKRGVLRGLWYVLASLYNGDTLRQSELDFAIHLDTGYQLDVQTLIARRKFIIDKMGWFSATGRPLVVRCSNKTVKKNTKAIMRTVFQVSDAVRMRSFRSDLQCRLSKCKKEEYQKHYHEIVNHRTISDHTSGGESIRRLHADITTLIRCRLKENGFIANNEEMLLRGEILGETDELAWSDQFHRLQASGSWKKFLEKHYPEG